MSKMTQQVAWQEAQPLASGANQRRLQKDKSASTVHTGRAGLGLGVDGGCGRGAGAAERRQAAGTPCILCIKHERALYPLLAGDFAAAKPFDALLWEHARGCPSTPGPRWRHQP